MQSRCKVVQSFCHGHRSEASLGINNVVNARISHLTESKSAAIEYAHPAAAAPGQDVPTKELPGREIPEGQSLEGYLRLTAWINFSPLLLPVSGRRAGN